MVRDEKLAKRLVVPRGACGNCTYDESANLSGGGNCLGMW